MVGLYFSGTGNSKYAAELFCKEYDKESGASALSPVAFSYTCFTT